MNASRRQHHLCTKPRDTARRSAMRRMLSSRPAYGPLNIVVSVAHAHVFVGLPPYRSWGFLFSCFDRPGIKRSLF